MKSDMEAAEKRCWFVSLKLIYKHKKLEDPTHYSLFVPAISYEEASNNALAQLSSTLEAWKCAATVEEVRNTGDSWEQFLAYRRD